MLKLAPLLQLTDEQFLEICRLNPDMKFEQTAKGELVIVAPTGGETGNSNFELATDFGIWNRRTQLGYGFDSSTCFQLPNGAKRAPDLAWIGRDRWEALSLEKRRKFPPIAPDFVLELMSPSDDLRQVQDKMREYLENGVQLGWLINPQNHQVEIYRPAQDVELLQNPDTLSGENVLPGFILNCRNVW